MSVNSFEAFHKRVIRSNENERWNRDIDSYEHYKSLLEKAKRWNSEKLQASAIEGMERIKNRWPNVKFD